MSSNSSREPAVRVFAAEYDDATHTFKEDDGEMAPNYILLPSGAKANRVLIVGALTEKEDVGDGDEYWRGRVVDPTGAVNVYAGEYEAEAAEVLRSVDTDTPHYVSVVGKPRTYETDEGDVRSTIRPESITVLDTGDGEELAEVTRDLWLQETAEQTMDRIDQEEDNTYVEMVNEQYGVDRASLLGDVISALETLEENHTEA